MEFKQNDYIYGIWYGELPGNKGNLLITLIKRGGAYLSEMRFRWYRIGSADEKSFYMVDFKTNDEKEAVENVTALICKMQTEMPNEITKGLINFDFMSVAGDMAKFLEECEKQKKPWMHITVVKVDKNEG